MDKVNYLYQLSRPWAYWCVKGSGKAVFDWVLPIVLSLMCAAIVDVSKHQINFFGAGGVLQMLTGFFQNLPGFFIAALAAVATFDRDELDESMPNPTPTICLYVKGRWTRVPLTRRRFLSTLFAFLSIQSIFVTLIGIGLVSCASWVRAIDSVSSILRYVSFGVVAIYSMFVWQMITVSCLGLYYLGDRIHQPDA